MQSNTADMLSSPDDSSPGEEEWLYSPRLRSHGPGDLGVVEPLCLSNDNDNDEDDPDSSQLASPRGPTMIQRFLEARRRYSQGAELPPDETEALATSPVTTRLQRLAASDQDYQLPTWNSTAPTLSVDEVIQQSRHIYADYLDSWRHHAAATAPVADSVPALPPAYFNQNGSAAGSPTPAALERHRGAINAHLVPASHASSPGQGRHTSTSTDPPTLKSLMPESAATSALFRQPGIMRQYPHPHLTSAGPPGYQCAALFQTACIATHQPCRYPSGPRGPISTPSRHHWIASTVTRSMFDRTPSFVRQYASQCHPYLILLLII
ncbi:hypothetical protein IWQ60_006231 [Tieghemiomyces parasiticus]|uniref:Uncharacterized protein n=1 Tax=Tieghemiomyces parasiticus TaxID=78921 RepID=A0A9W8DY60_9FUNG|nr:hypothetical protein IWQ60_006231 [Tieghemiomyces parasiticus]